MSTLNELTRDLLTAFIAAFEPNWCSIQLYFRKNDARQQDILPTIIFCGPRFGHTVMDVIFMMTVLSEDLLYKLYRADAGNAFNEGDQFIFINPQHRLKLINDRTMISFTGDVPTGIVKNYDAKTGRFDVVIDPLPGESAQVYPYTEEKLKAELALEEFESFHAFAFDYGPEVFLPLPELSKALEEETNRLGSSHLLMQ